MKMKHWIVCMLVCLGVCSAHAQSVGWLTVYEHPDNVTFDYDAHLYVDGAYMTDLPATVALKPGRHEILIKSEFCLDYKADVKVEAGVRKAFPVNLIENGRPVEVRSDDDALIYVDGRLTAMGKTSVNLVFGTHRFVAEKEGCRPSELLSDVTSGTHSVTVPSPQPFTGVLVVNSSADGADVFVDDVLMGRTPLTIDGINVGDYKVSLFKDGYAGAEMMVSVAADERTVMDVDLERLSTVNIHTNLINPEINVGGRDMPVNSFQLRKGRYPLDLSAKGYKPLRKTIDVKDGVNDYRYRLRREYGPQYSEDGGIYANVGYQMLRYPALEINAGIDAGINVEISMLTGLKRSGYVPVVQDYSFSYKPALYIGLGFGYNIYMGNRFKMTPQIGIGTMWCTSSQSSDQSLTEEAEQYELLGTLSFVFGAKLEFALCSWCGLYVKPNYTAPVLSKDSGVRQVMSLSPEVARYFKGLGVNVGINFHYDL